MSDCSTLTLLNALLIAVAPAVAGFAGFYLNHRWESKRQLIQREFDLGIQRQQTRRNLLEQLQYALAAVNDGSALAVTFMFAGEEVGVEAARIVLSAPWFQEWQKGAQKVAIFAAQLGDDDLAGAALEVGISLDLVLAARGDRKAFDLARTQLEASYVRANARAGKLIHEIDVSSLSYPQERLSASVNQKR